jgi:hypothetical protein
MYASKVACFVFCLHTFQFNKESYSLEEVYAAWPYFAINADAQWSCYWSDVATWLARVAAPLIIRAILGDPVMGAGSPADKTYERNQKAYISSISELK